MLKESTDALVNVVGSAPALPSTYRVYRYQAHRGLSHEDAPALEVYPSDIELDATATDGALQREYHYVVRWSEPSAYGAETGDHNADANIAERGLNRGEAILAELRKLDGRVVIGSTVYAVTPDSVQLGLRDGLLWSFELELTLEVLA